MTIKDTIIVHKTDDGLEYLTDGMLWSDDISDAHVFPNRGVAEDCIKDNGWTPKEVIVGTGSPDKYLVTK